MTANVDSRSDEKLLSAAAEWPDCSSLRELNAESLQAISAEQGLDFATALLYDRVNKSLAEQTGLQAEELLRESPDCNFGSSKPRIAVIPGAFHELRKFNTAGRAILDHARALGLPTATIPIQSFGSLRDNAAIVVEWLRECDERPIILVSLSKGGADLKQALLESAGDPVWNKVQGWLNLSGLCEGTPLADWLTECWYRSLLVRPLFAWRGYEFQNFQELKFGLGKPLHAELQLPEHLTAIHVLGFPRQRHLSSNMARRGHRRLSAFGPNDGSGIVLETAVRRSGLILPIWGVDHFLQHEQLSAAAIFQAALVRIGRMTQADRQLYCEVRG